MSEILAGCSLIPPTVVHSYCAGLVEPGPDGAACKVKAQQVMIRRLKRSGLVGLPMWSEGGGAGGEHWTLLIVRRLHQQIQLRYYDSLEVTSAHNFAAAEVVLQMLFEELGQAVPQLERTNKSTQHNGVDCGAFVLHYWEGEVRRFRGEGWPLSYPWTAGPIKARKTRLISFVAQVRRSNAQLEGEGEDPQAKGLENTSLSTARLQMLELSELAVKAQGQGFVEFYGCQVQMGQGRVHQLQVQPCKVQSSLREVPRQIQHDGAGAIERHRPNRC